MFLLRSVIPTLTPGSSPKSFLRPAAGIGYKVAAVAVKHPSLLSLRRVLPPSVTIGTKQAEIQEVLSPFVG